MALSFEESKKQLSKFAETPMVMSLSLENEAATMSLNDDGIVSYADENWERHTNYTYYSVFSDDNISTINDKKDISLNDKQINITQEENSQYIPFEMSRYYDGYDLVNALISIHYTTKNGHHGGEKAINVFYTSDKIRFGWLVDAGATLDAGTLEFEIHANGVVTGNDGISKAYTWKSKPNKDLNVLQSICDCEDTINNIDDSWMQELVADIAESIAQEIKNVAVGEQVAAAETAASNAYNYAAAAQQSAINASNSATAAVNEVLSAYATTTYVDEKVAAVDVSEQLTEYAKTEYVDEAIKSIDVTEELSDYAKITDVDEKFNDYDISVTQKINSSLENYATKDDVSDAISSADLDSYYKKTETYSKLEVDEKVANVKVDLTGYATETYVNNKEATLKTDIDANKTNITSLGTTVTDLQTTINSIDTSPRLTYDVVYNDTEDPDVGENVFVFYEIENEGVEGEEKREAKKKFTIVGGSGGGSTSSSLKIGYVTKSPLVVTINDKAVIKYTFSGTDSSGDDVTEGTATWKVAGRVVATNIAINGENEFDITEHLSIGSQKVVLSITDEAGSLVTKNWTVQKIDVRLESTFNDKLTYPIGAVSFDFTPYGAISKDIHFILDGEEIGIVSTASSGIPMAYELPSQEHGSHLLEVYMTATINGNEIESNHIFKDIAWFDASSKVPVITSIYQNFTARQYDTTNIEYTVNDPTTETPTVTIAVDGKVVSTPTLTTSTNVYPYKETVAGNHVITIVCGETIKTLTANIEELDIDVSPVTAGLVFDFNPVGKSNNDADRLWSSGDIAMTVSDNFDWVNGGYQLDANGDQYFCIKAGTSAEINYKLFADDAKRNGKEFKLIFKTTNVSSSNATFLKCLDSTTETNHIGVQMDVHEARIYAMSENLPLPYAEDEVIEFEFNINKNTETPHMVMGYEDGVSTRPLVYEDSHNFTQTTPQNISLGSSDCDLHIYRFKVYNTSLTDRGILSNFIADARNAEEMVSRYNRNQIYDENGQLTPEVLAEKCPWLRIIKLDVPRFTQDKDDKVSGCTIQYIYKDGDPILDNWICTDAVHSGQGTSSNNYGPSGRNLDLILKTYKDYGNNPIITLGDGSTTVKKVSLTRNSVESNYWNIKVNIASSENANNALLQKRYNEYNPYKRPFVREDETEIPKIKDTMEFFNCVIFVRENNEDLSTHVEFADRDWHYYAFGNIGDSKKTDSSRLTDPTDPYECVLEVMDNTLPNSTMPTGKVDENGYPVYPISPSEWAVGNSAYDALMAEKFDEKKATDKENGKADTYGWRYIWEDGSDEENEEVRTYVENKWREFYQFVVTSTNEEFKAHLGDYVVLDSVLYYYLFTLRYTMTDNHAKNSFFHYGKSNDVDSDGNPIRKWDLCFDYDNDTALGIDNYGRMTYRYGYEEIDFVDGTKDWVWNCPNHVLFLRIRELFDDELCELYRRLESLGCWSATSLINQFNDWQAQFPEELWRVDIIRKYIRTFTESYINGEARPEFLKERANGRKKTQRSQFERNQEKYMASKFGGTVASADDIILRCSVPNTELAVEPNFDMHLTPYSHIYLNVKYNTSPPLRVRAEPNKEYTIEYDSDLADIIEIYSASSMTNIGDLSTCYLTNGDFANASKIRELKLGNDTEGYNNTNVMTLGLGANTLLNKLDIQNMSGLSHALDLTSLKNLEELYAHGSNIGGVTFADGGIIEIAELPAINAMTMKNLTYLTNLDVTSFDKLTNLVVENCSTVDLVSILNEASNVNRVRIVGINWSLENTSLLERLYSMSGIDRDGYNVDQSVLTGKVHVPVIRQQQLYDYQQAWSDLEITFDTMIEQFAVTFMNTDGNVIEVQYVDKGEDAVDPTTRAENKIIPTIDSTISHDFTFSHWNVNLTDIFADRIITAVYSESLRSYTIKYVSKGITMQESIGLYGENVPYTGVMPTYTAEESGYVYNLFDRWDKSGFIDGNKTVNAIFDTFTYTGTEFENMDLSEMRPVEIYAMIKLGLESKNVVAKDSIVIDLGSDFTYSDITEVELILEKIDFDGTNYIEFNGSSDNRPEVKLFDEDKDFVLAIDYSMSNENTYGKVLCQCYNYILSQDSGFKLMYDSGCALQWGSNSSQVTDLNSREMLVIRHIKGENGVYVYTSNTNGSDTSYIELSSAGSMAHEGFLRFGCGGDSSIYENYASGSVYWSKVWYADLGEETCKKIAYWPHESVSFEMCGLSRYYLSDGSGKRCSMSFLASDALSKAMQLNSANTTVGGWAKCTLNTYLNGRIYNAISDKWKQLMKSFTVRSTAGSLSSEMSSCGCYIAIPSVADIVEGMGAPYTSEINPPAISIMENVVNVSDKILYNSSGTAVEYWTRSPYATFTGTTPYYNYCIQATGSAHGINTPTTAKYVRMVIAF